MALPSVFISYNPNSDMEQTLAVRLHTIGAVHGFNMLLPYRVGFNRSITNETKSRIQSSDFFILFSTTSLSNLVLEEIQIAANKLHDKSKILVIYDISVGQNLKNADNFTPIFINRNWAVEKIMEEIISKVKIIQSKSNGEGGFLSALGPILLTGVALFALSSVLDEPAKPKRSVKRKIVIAKKRSKKMTKKVGG